MAGAPGTTDFYSIALHEIGHALGLSTSFDDWTDNVSGGYFTRANAVAAYNADNGTALAKLLLQTAGNHWNDGSYDSRIFSAASPIYVGTVGSGSLQDLVMEPTANFIFPSLRRFEVTNVDVGALQDMGWSTISTVAKTAVEITSFSRSAAGVATVVWFSEIGASYTVETSLDLDTWSDVTPAVVAGGTSSTWTDGAGGFVDPNPTSAVVAAKYYRIRRN